jgi:hypothetical protein
MSGSTRSAMQGLRRCSGGPNYHTARVCSSLKCSTMKMKAAFLKQMVSTIMAMVKAKSMVVQANMGVLKTWVLILLSLDSNNACVRVVADGTVNALYAAVLPS